MRLHLTVALYKRKLLVRWEYDLVDTFITCSRALVGSDAAADMRQHTRARKNAIFYLDGEQRRN